MADPILYIATADLKLTLSGGGSPVQYNGQVTDARVVPSPGEERSITTLDGTRHVRVGVPGFTLEMTGAQDWREPEGLARFLWDHAGAQATFQLNAHGSGATPTIDKPAMSGTVVLAEGVYGGEADTWSTLEVKLSCTGRPTLVVA